VRIGSAEISVVVFGRPSEGHAAMKRMPPGGGSGDKKKSASAYR
jgi:hypothetical protein